MIAQKIEPCILGCDFKSVRQHYQRWRIIFDNSRNNGGHGHNMVTS